MEKKKIFLSCPTMHGQELHYIQEAFDTNWVAPLGPNVNEFEKEFAAYLGEGYAAALSAGTGAIHLALIIAGVRRDDIVFGSSLTFAATVNPITYIGAKPVFIDSEEDSWNMDPAALEKAFSLYPSAKAVISANLYGTPGRLEEIAAICKKHGVPFIEDAAESLGASVHGRQTGLFGDIGIFSFNGNKIITTSGGGMLVSRDEEVVKKPVFSRHRRGSRNAIMSIRKSASTTGCPTSSQGSDADSFRIWRSIRRRRRKFICAIRRRFRTLSTFG